MAGLTEALLAAGDPALTLFTRRDLLGERRHDPCRLWEMPEVLRILKRQQPDGSWLFPGAKPGLAYGEDYTQVETFRWLGRLIEQYGMDRRHSALDRAAEYVFRCQTSAGDFRGVYGSHYAPGFCGSLAALLARAGYAGDPRLENCFEWFRYMRQQDGGWVTPFRTSGLNYYTAMPRHPVEPDRTRPFSHVVTGTVLRAFAFHPKHRRDEAAQRAAGLLASRIFKKDCYPDRSGPEFWRKINFPAWHTDVVSALESFSLIGVPSENPGAAKALAWIRSRQRADGLFHFYTLRNRSVINLDAWLTLVVARILKRYGI